MKLPSNYPSCLQYNRPLGRYTSMGVGGRVSVFAEPTSLTELLALASWVQKERIPTLFLGSGTNLLVSDRGFRGCAIRLNRREFTRMSVVEEPDTRNILVTCGAGTPTQRIVLRGVRQRFGPMRSFAGLPGSIGGAVAMNAQNIGACVERVTVMTPQGTVEERHQRDLQFRYRYSQLDGAMVVQVVLRFTSVDEMDAQAVRDVFARRRTTQELRLPSSGCAFKNPSVDQPAGRLIDTAGLKGARVGDARVSSIHANFIVNAGMSTSTDVLRLMERMQRRVHRAHGMWLEPEVRIIGERWESGGQCQSTWGRSDT